MYDFLADAEQVLHLVDLIKQVASKEGNSSDQQAYATTISSPNDEGNALTTTHSPSMATVATAPGQQVTASKHATDSALDSPPSTSRDELQQQAPLPQATTTQVEATKLKSANGSRMQTLHKNKKHHVEDTMHPQRHLHFLKTSPFNSLAFDALKPSAGAIEQIFVAARHELPNVDGVPQRTVVRHLFSPASPLFNNTTQSDVEAGDGIHVNICSGLLDTSAKDTECLSDGSEDDGEIEGMEWCTKVELPSRGTVELSLMAEDLGVEARRHANVLPSTSETPKHDTWALDGHGIYCLPRTLAETATYADIADTRYVYELSML